MVTKPPDSAPDALDAQRAGVEDRLDSWKEIATYMRRGVRTVKRWEKEEGLPVHRHLHKRLGTVYAYKAEVDAWLTSRAHQLHHDEEDEDNAVPPDEDEQRAVPLAAGRWRLTAVLGSALLATTTLAFLFWPHGSAAPAAVRRVMLAVLPFENLSPAEYEFFSDGLTEDMILALSNHNPQRLGVIARTSSMAYKGARKTIAQIASELNVDYVLEGSARREGDRVRITTQLIRTDDQTHLWAQAYDRSIRGIGDVQAEVVRSLTEAIRVERDPGRHLISTASVSSEAFEAALRGRYFLDRRTAPDIERARKEFERAITLEPGYALAHVGIADSYILSMTYADLPPSQAVPLARQAILTALRLDEGLPAAHAWMGVILCEYDWNWTGAEEQFKRAIELNPNFAYGHKLYGEFLSYIGRFDEAISEARLARRLDPVSVVNNTLVGLVLYRARRYREAAAELGRAIELDPRHPMSYLPQGLSYSMREMHREAVAALDRGLELTPGSSELIAQAGLVHARAGRVDRARSALAELGRRSLREHVSPFLFALLHIGLGDLNTAEDWLERGYAERDWYLCVLKTEPTLDPLRGNVRFEALLRRVNFQN